MSEVSINNSNEEKISLIERARMWARLAIDGNIQAPHGTVPKAFTKPSLDRESRIYSPPTFGEAAQSAASGEIFEDMSSSFAVTSENSLEGHANVTQLHAGKKVADVLRQRFAASTAFNRGVVDPGAPQTIVDRVLGSRLNPNPAQDQLFNPDLLALVAHDQESLFDSNVL
jgi:hypothetical protein